MTSNNEIFDRVKKIIINHLGAEEGNVPSKNTIYNTRIIW
jgi:acyl carrier protein